MYPGGSRAPSPWQEGEPLRTSGMAIASLVMGSIGLFTCCLAVPSILAVFFAAIALPPIGREEFKGRGLAIGGLVLGIVGLLAGIGFWVFVAITPSTKPIPGAQISKKDRAILEKLGVVSKGEEIELFFSGGMTSIKEGGVVITATHLVIYGEGGSPQKTRLAEVNSVDFTPGKNWIDDGQFLLTLDNGKTVTFAVGSQDSADKLFYKVLAKKVTQTRRSVGKNFSLTAPPDAESDEDKRRAKPGRSAPGRAK